MYSSISPCVMVPSAVEAISEKIRSEQIQKSFHLNYKENAVAKTRWNQPYQTNSTHKSAPNWKVPLVQSPETFHAPNVLCIKNSGVNARVHCGSQL